MINIASELLHHHSIKIVIILIVVDLKIIIMRLLYCLIITLNDALFSI